MKTERTKWKTKHFLSWIKEPLVKTRGCNRWLPYRRKGRVCPVCEKTSRSFEPFGSPPRSDAGCMFCGAVEHLRYVWRHFESETNLFDGKQTRALHVAPESCFETRLRNRLGQDYVTADLFDPLAMVRMILWIFISQMNTLISFIAPRNSGLDGQLKHSNIYISNFEIYVHKILCQDFFVSNKNCVMVFA